MLVQNLCSIELIWDVFFDRPLLGTKLGHLLQYGMKNEIWSAKDCY